MLGLDPGRCVGTGAWAEICPIPHPEKTAEAPTEMVPWHACAQLCGKRSKRKHQELFCAVRPHVLSGPVQMHTPSGLAFCSSVRTQQLQDGGAPLLSDAEVPPCPCVSDDLDAISRPETQHNIAVPGNNQQHAVMKDSVAAVKSSSSPSPDCSRSSSSGDGSTSSSSSSGDNCSSLSSARDAGTSTTQESSSASSNRRPMTDR